MSLACACVSVCALLPYITRCTAQVAYRGKVRDIIKNLVGGLARWVNARLCTSRVTAEIVHKRTPHEQCFSDTHTPSGISYCGAHNIVEMQRNAEFVTITDSGRRESNAHDVEVL